MTVVLLSAGAIVVSAQSFSDRVDLANGAEFQRRISFAITKSAIAVMGEDPADNAQRHMARVQLAEFVLKGPAVAARRFSLPVATDMDITAESTDAEIESSVLGLWDALAGVAATEGRQ